MNAKPRPLSMNVRTHAAAVSCTGGSSPNPNGYNATYSPASSFSVAPSYSSPGYMNVEVTNTGKGTWAANTILNSSAIATTLRSMPRTKRSASRQRRESYGMDSSATCLPLEADRKG